MKEKDLEVLREEQRRRAEAIGAGIVDDEKEMDKWPFVVADAAWKRDQYNQLVLSTGCAGCVIGPDVVLSSGHCGFDQGGLVHIGLRPPTEGQSLNVILKSKRHTIAGRDLKVVQLTNGSSDVVEFYKGHLNPGDEIPGTLHLGWGKFLRDCGQAAQTTPLDGIGFKLEVGVRVSSDGRTLEMMDTDKSLCGDDSGGPLLAEEDGVWRLLGIAQSGPCHCESKDLSVFDFVAPIRTQIMLAAASL